MIDTHAHLYEPEYDDDREETLQRALGAGVTRFYLPNINEESIPRMMALAERHPETCFPMMGLHPEDVKSDWSEVLDRMELQLRGKVAVGEVGLDFYWDDTFRKEQIEAFRRQTEWAFRHGIPLVIHQRKAENEVHEVLRSCHGNELRGVFHCFSGSVESARRVMSYEGFFVGIGGIVTFKNAKLGEVLRSAVPLERVVLETDCPYLTPVPHRGERNESSFLTSVCGKLAEIYNLSPGEVEKVTDDNARRLFGA